VHATDLHERRGVEGEGLCVQDALQVFQTAVNAVDVIGQFRPETGSDITGSLRPVEHADEVTQTQVIMNMKRMRLMTDLSSRVETKRQRSGDSPPAGGGGRGLREAREETPGT